MQDTKNSLAVERLTNAYSVKVQQFTASAEEKLIAVGGEVLSNVKASTGVEKDEVLSDNG